MKHQYLQFYSPEAEAALRYFLSQAVLPGKRARYLDLISRPNARKKFLDTLHHEFERHLDPAKRVEALSPEQLELSGYRFDPSIETLGKPERSMAAAAAAMDESCLVVSTDGKTGIHTPEFNINGRTFHAL